MYTLIASQDYTPDVSPDTMSIATVLSDPMSQATLNVFDPGSTYKIRSLLDIVILDENGLANPAWNLLLNPSLISTSSGNYYNSESSGAAPVMSFPGTGVQFSYSNIASGQFANCNQDIQLGLVVPGVTYMLSAYVQASVGATGLTNAAFLTITYKDGAGNNLGQTFTTVTPTSTQVRISAQLVAPAGTIYVTVSLGAQSHTNTNSGTITYTTAQFEPMCFVAEGQSYPSPDCNPAQTNCYVLPNGTTIRQSRLFAGQIIEDDRIYDDPGGDTGASKDRTHQLTCNSAEWLLETTNLVNKSYTNMYDSDIIADILSSELTMQGTGTGQVLPIPMITGNHVVQGYLVTDTITWDGISIREALNQLVALSNFNFWVDHYFDLHYVPNFYGTTSFGLSDTPDNLTTFAYDDLEVDDVGSQIRNRIQVNGGNYSNPVQPPQSFNGDGVTKVFTLNFQPDNMLGITVNSAQQNVLPAGQGTLGVNGLQVQWDKSTPKITFHTAPPAGVNNVTVSYTYPSPVRVRVWDMQSISNQKGRIYDSKIEDSSLLTPQAAIQRGEAEADQWANPVATIKFNTLQPLMVGNVVPFTCVCEDLANYPLLIQKVTIAPQFAGVYQYQIESGQYLPDVIDLLTNTHKALNRSKAVAGLPLLQEVLYSHDTLNYTEAWSDTSP